MKKVISIILAVLASILLVCTLAITPIMYGVGAFITEETFVNVLHDLDYAEVLGAGGDVQQELGFTAEEINEIMATEGMKEIMNVYVSDLFLPINGSYKTATLTLDKAKEIIREHASELNPYTASFFKTHGFEGEIPVEELTEYTVELFASYTSVLPTADDLGLTDPDTLLGIQAIKSGVVIVPFVVIAAILSLIVLVCRLAKFESMLWLGVDYGLAGLATFGLANALNSASSIDASLTAYLPIFKAFSSNVQTASLVILGCAVLFVVIHFVGKKLKTKKQEEVIL